MNFNNITYLTGQNGQLVPFYIQTAVQEETDGQQLTYSTYHEIEKDVHSEMEIISISDSTEEQVQGTSSEEFIFDHNGEPLSLDQLLEYDNIEEVQNVADSSSQAINDGGYGGYYEQQSIEVIEPDMMAQKVDNVEIVYEIQNEEINNNETLSEANNCTSKPTVETTAITTHFCPHCGNSYNAPGSLKLHMRACVRPRFEVPLSDRQCKVCNKVFKTRNYLKDHMITHINVTTFRCGRCYRKFIDENKFKAHIAGHQHQDKLNAAAKQLSRQQGGKKVVKEYKCSFCAIDFLVAFEAGSVKRRYACDDCRVKYAEKEALEQHKEMNAVKREFICDRCGRKFVFEGFLHRHQPSCDGKLKRRFGGPKQPRRAAV